MNVRLSWCHFAPRKLGGFLLMVAVLAPMQAASAPASVRAERVIRPYFVEFRARPSGDIGHSLVVYGRRDARGRPASLNYASLVPRVDGHYGMILPIKADVRASYDDIHAQPITSYRRDLSAAQFARVQMAVRQMKARLRLWHAFFFNCNDLPAVVAEAIGLRRPPSIMPPNLWVDTLRMLNGP
jgi:hypothetical protein